MKKILLFILFPIASFAQEIQFENNTWNDIVKKAKSQNKIIFVDAFTTWCGPCKAMAKKVFTDKAVSDFYNTNFVNAKIDMEKGEGIELAKKYAVTAYPTYLFVDGDGNLLHKGLGYMEAGPFIELAKDASIPNKQISGMSQKFKNGDRNPEFLFNLLNVAKKVDDPNVSVYASEYFKTQKNLLTKENINLILETIKDPYASEYTFLVKNETEVSKLIDAETLKYLDFIALNYFISKINAEETFEKNMHLYEKIFNEVRPGKVDKYKTIMSLNVAEIKNDIVLKEKYILEYVELNFETLDATQLNNYAWNFFEKVTNKESLKKALKWSIKSVELSNEYYSIDTLANLYYKLGDKKNAKLYAEKAIKLGKEKGEDTTSTEDLLKKL